MQDQCPGKKKKKKSIKKSLRNVRTDVICRWIEVMNNTECLLWSNYIVEPNFPLCFVLQRPALLVDGRKGRPRRRLSVIAWEEIWAIWAICYCYCCWMLFFVLRKHVPRLTLSPWSQPAQKSLFASWALRSSWEHNHNKENNLELHYSWGMLKCILNWFETNPIKRMKYSPIRSNWPKWSVSFQVHLPPHSSK